MPKKVDCSELSRVISDIALTLGARPGMNTVDRVTAEMSKEIPSITAKEVANAIVEAMGSDTRTQSEISKQIAKLKKEARKLSSVKPRISTSLKKTAQAFAKYFVSQGVSNRDALVDSVYNELKGVIPGISRREVMDAISGYGDLTQLSKDEIDVRLRDLKGQLQQVGKLEDMAAGQAPLKSGLERRTPSDEERGLIQQVEEAKKKGGFTARDPELELKSALSAIKTRLKNQIKDLEKQIETRERIVKQKAPTPTDAEVEVLRKRRDELKVQFEEVFGKPGMSDEQRVAAARKAIEKSIANYEQQLAAGESALKTTRPPIVTPELEALRKRRDKARQAVLSSEWFRRQRIEKQIKELEAKLAVAPVVRAKRSEMPASKELERLQYERDLLRARINNRIRAMKPKGFWGHAAEPINLSRAIITSVDFSAVLRQGGFIAFGHPVRAAKATLPMFRAAFSKQAAHRIYNEIMGRVNAPRYAQSKLYLAPPDSAAPLRQQEEAYMSHWSDRIPWWIGGQLVAASQRAYVTFLNVLRADSFDAMAATLARNGEPNAKESQAIAYYINVATGRGNLGKNLEPAATALATIFFAPRYVASRFQIVVGNPIYGGKAKGGTARTRKLIATEYARYLIGLGVFYSLMMMALGDEDDAEISGDPTSSDFGKIRLGNVRIDPLSGFAQTTVLMGREGQQLLKTMRGEKRTFTEPSGFSIGARFLRTKFSPIIGSGVDLLTGENVVGEEVTPKSMSLNLLTPLAMREVYEAMEEEGVTKGAAFGLLAIFGFGLQVYETKDPGARPKRPTKRPTRPKRPTSSARQ